MAGIDSLISNRVDAFANNPQALMQRYSMSQDLLDLLALQKLKQEKEAVARTLQMQMQAPQGTVKDQLEGQVMDMTRREVAQAAAPGLQQQGQRMVANQMQEAMGAGLPTQPAPALQGMAQGGIVGYQEGGPPTTPYGRQRAERRAEGQRRRDELAINEELYKTYAPSAGILGLFKPQTDEERARAQRIMESVPNLSYADKLALAATGRLPQEQVDNDYVRMMENPELAQTDFDRAKAMGLIPEERPAAPAAPAAPTALEEIVSGITKQASDVAGLSGMRKETALPQEEADTPQAERPQFRSRYEDRLAAIEAEKQDKLGALIEFLQAAGASRGTNLGATLTGGGSGLRARDERLRQQETEALKSAVEEENAYLQRMFNEEQLRQQADIARQNREMQERISEADRIAEAKRYGEQARLTQAQIDARKAEVDSARTQALELAKYELQETQTTQDSELRQYAMDLVPTDRGYIAESERIYDNYKDDPTMLQAEMGRLTRQTFNRLYGVIKQTMGGAGPVNSGSVTTGAGYIE
jgi:hypothetical protein